MKTINRTHCQPRLTNIAQLFNGRSFLSGQTFYCVLCGSNPRPFLVEPDPDKMCLLIKINQHFQVHAVLYELPLYGVIGALM